MEPTEQPPKLDYGQAQHTNVLGPVLLIFGGGILGAGGIVFIGVLAGFATYSAQATGADRRADILPIIVFGLFLIAAITGCVWAIRRPRCQWFIVGLLLGVGIASLLEGICFASF